jgi:hypothetical protein
MGLLKLKPNKKLNGKVWTAGDIAASLSTIQQQHVSGELDVYAPLIRNGIQYPSIADQWKVDAARRFQNGK